MSTESLVATTRRVAFAQTLWQAASKLLGLIAAFAAAALIAHGLPVATFAAYGLCLVLLSVLATLADAGLGPVTVVRLAADAQGATPGGLIRLRVIAAATVGAVGCVAAAVTALLGFGALAVVVASASTAAAFQVSGTSVLLRAQVELRNELFTFVDGVGQLATFGGAVAVVAVHGGAALTVATLPLAQAARLGFAVGCARATHLLGWERLAPSLRHRFLRDSRPMLAWNVIGSVHIRAGALLVYAVLGASAFAPCALALRVVDLFLAAPTFVLGSTVPVLAASWSADRDRFVRVRQVIIDTLFPVGFALTASVIVAAPWVCALAGGQKFPSGAGMIRLFMVAGACIWCNTLFVALAVVRDRQRAAVKVGVVSLTVNLLLAGALLVPAKGWAAPLASMFAELVLTGLVGYVALSNSRPTPSWSRSAVAGLVSGSVAVSGILVGRAYGTVAAVTLCLPVLLVVLVSAMGRLLGDRASRHSRSFARAATPIATTYETDARRSR